MAVGLAMTRAMPKRDQSNMSEHTNNENGVFVFTRVTHTVGDLEGFLVGERCVDVRRNSNEWLDA